MDDMTSWGSTPGDEADVARERELLDRVRAARRRLRAAQLELAAVEAEEQVAISTALAFYRDEDIQKQEQYKGAE